MMVQMLTVKVAFLKIFCLLYLPFIVLKHWRFFTWSISVLYPPPPMLRWWNCVDPPTHTWNMWTSSVCSPVWACGCFSECSAPCCLSGESYSRPKSSGQFTAWQTNNRSSIVSLIKKFQRYLRQEDTWVVPLLTLGCFSLESTLDRYVEGLWLWAGGRFVCSTGSWRRKTLAAAWNAKLSDLKWSSFFGAGFPSLFEKCYDFRP